MTTNYQEQMNEILSYSSKYYERITNENLQQAVDDFLKSYSTWKNAVGYKNGEEEYGNVLVIFSVAISELNPITEGLIDTLTKEVQEYENSVEDMFQIKLSLYANLGLCWHKLGVMYDNLAIEAFKRYIFYQLKLSNHTSYWGLTCYSFRSCSKFFFQSLVNDTLNLSSPTAFNDIFDCPIMGLLDNGDDISKLIREAYLSGVKVACFVKNEKLPYSNDTSDAPITNDKKNRRDKKEYL